MSRYSQEKAWSDFRVGLVTFAALALLILGVTFVGGDKGLLFHNTSLVKARLVDVGGLKKGSSVTMGGMVVGRVIDIRFVDGTVSTTPTDPKVQSPRDGSKGNQIEVSAEVRSDVRSRIKTDSVPAVRTQGMLGDRYIDISMGREAAQPLPEGQILLGEEATDFDKTLRQASQVLKETDKLLSAVNDQRGTAGQLVYNEELYKSLTQITNELNSLIKDFKKNPRRYIKFSVF